MSLRERVLHRLTRSDFVRKTYALLYGIPLLHGAARKFAQTVIPPGTRLWIQVPDGIGQGLWLNADPRFELGYSNGDHEPWIQDLLKAELRPGDCYYDVGAHSGFFSLIASRFVGLRGKIVAFEPDPEIAATLKANLEKNGVTQAEIVQAAVWSSSDQLTFASAPQASNRTQGHVACSKADALLGISVRAVRLDDLIYEEGYPMPQLIKMDIEGAEWDALQGARRLFTEGKPKLSCEIHDIRQMGQIRAYLEQFGYSVEESKPIHPHYADYLQVYIWATPRV